MTGLRHVDVADALAWLVGPGYQKGAVITGPPDASDVIENGVSIPISTYRSWLRDAVSTAIDASTGPTVVAVTDRRDKGRLISKAGVVMEAAADMNRDLLWHRIALRQAPGTVNLYVPTFTHVIAIGPGRPGKQRPDVIPAGGTLSWKHGVTHDLARYVADWACEVGITTVVDPFAGYGTFLAAANEVGLDALGCEIDPQRAAIAREYAL